MNDKDLIVLLQNKVRELSKLLDDQFGTPCEQIRHKDEIDRLTGLNMEQANKLWNQSVDAISAVQHAYKEGFEAGRKSARPVIREIQPKCKCEYPTIKCNHLGCHCTACGGMA